METLRMEVYHECQQGYGPTSESPTQRDRILSLLRQRGPADATNAELNQICFRYGARIFELRKVGYAIGTRAEGDGLFCSVSSCVATQATRSRCRATSMARANRRPGRRRSPLVAHA